MLNISKNSLNRKPIEQSQSAFRAVSGDNFSKKIVYFISTVFFLGLVILFFPWTQNISARGKLTTLNPKNREQTIHSLISGRIDNWYVQEGQEVKKGDTLVFISEIKSDYLDPNIVARAKNQTLAKNEAVKSYHKKVLALNNQIDALEKSQVVKITQAENKITQSRLAVISDSIEWETAQIKFEIAENQFERQAQLYNQGLKSLTEFQNSRQKFQESVNKKTSAQNKLETSRNKLENAILEKNNLANEFNEKISKALSDRQSALSSGFDAESQLNKLQIQQEGYERRSHWYYITAPQDGYITKALVLGVGEVIKEGKPLFTFVPKNDDLAVELYVRPLDLPLIKEGVNVQLQFDGWPAMVFSGWPGLSIGTYRSTVVSYDKVVSKNGKFRILAIPTSDTTQTWPNLLRLGTGVKGIAMLKTVPVWYELWRNLNGFPPDFYTDPTDAEPDKKAKK